MFPLLAIRIQIVKHQSLAVNPESRVKTPWMVGVMYLYRSANDSNPETALNVESFDARDRRR